MPNVSGMNKEPLFRQIYNHMLTIDDCSQCGGNCNPMSHLFPPLGPDIMSPHNSPPPRNMRSQSGGGGGGLRRSR